MHPISGIILAGGHSRRMGYDKRRMRLWGDHAPTLLEQTVQRLAPLCADLIVVLNDPAAWHLPPARLVRDAWHDGGPLGGLVSGLQVAAWQHTLVVAADLPHLNAAVLRAMLERPRTYDVLLPYTSHPTTGVYHPEPLHAVYRVGAAATLRGALQRGIRQMQQAIALLHTVPLPPAVWQAHDPGGQTFFNLNTPRDVQALRYNGRTKSTQE